MQPGEPAARPARRRLQAPAPEKLGGDEGVGAQRVGPLLCQLPPPTHPPTYPKPAFFPVICALGKHGWVPGKDAYYLGS